MSDSLNNKHEVVDHLGCDSPTGCYDSSIACEPSLHGDLLVHDVRPAAERRLVRMLDSRLLPCVSVIHLLNQMDVSF